MGVYAAAGRLVIIAEERERKYYREAQAVICEAACGGSVLLNREMFRVNALGFFSGKTPVMTLTGEIYALGHSDTEEEIFGAIMENFGEDMERVV